MHLADLMALIYADVEADDVYSTQESGRAGRIHQVFPVSSKRRLHIDQLLHPVAALQQAVFAPNPRFYRVTQ